MFSPSLLSTAITALVLIITIWTRDAHIITPRAECVPFRDVVELADADRDDGGDDGQEQSGGSQEDKSGNGTMAIALAKYPNSDYESCQYGTAGLQCVHTPYPLFQALVERGH